MVRVLYLGGLGRSGTTLLERLLGELPGVCPLGEVVHLWSRDVRDDERCACGEAFSVCPFWQRVGAVAYGGWANVNPDRIDALQTAVERTRHIPWLARRRMRAARRALVEEYVGHYRSVYRAAAERARASVVVDSSKHASLAFCLRWCEGIDLRVVHLVRDSRGVAYSWTKQVARPEAAGNAEMTRYSPIRAALLWNAHNAAFGLLRRRGVPVYRLRYEELMAEPARTLRAVAAFAGIDIAPDALDFLSAHEADLGSSHSAAGNPMRFRTGRIPLQRDDAWREALPGGQRRLVSALTAPLLGAYGYPLSGRK